MEPHKNQDQVSDRGGDIRMGGLDVFRGIWDGFGVEKQV